MKLQGARTIITGGTRGIGRALGEALRDEGARVLACGSRASSVRRFAEQTGIAAVCCDVAEPEDVRGLVEEVTVRLGGLDLLIHCAGIQQELDFVRGLDMGDVEREIAVNLTGPIRVTDALRELLLRSPAAAIVDVTSVLATTPKRRAPVYCATKAALASWTVALRDQLAAHRVNVMELVPPLVATDMTHERSDGAIEPTVVARACIEGLRRDARVVRVGKARLAHWVHRVVPGLLARSLRDS